jgi:hypothetical protein
VLPAWHAAKKSYQYEYEYKYEYEGEYEGVERGRFWCSSL